MGKGDRRTKRGKIINGSFGKSRPAGRPKPSAAQQGAKAGAKKAKEEKA